MSITSLPQDAMIIEGMDDWERRSDDDGGGRGNHISHLYLLYSSIIVMMIDHLL
jgi:hypothetical protein